MRAPVPHAIPCNSTSGLPIAVPHDTPEVIHPFIVAKLQAYIATHPGDLRVPRDPSRDLPEKAIPADYRMVTPQQWVAERTAEAEQLLWRKTCKQCHTLMCLAGERRRAAENRPIEYHGAIYAAREFRSFAARPRGLRELPRRRAHQPAKLRRAAARASPTAAHATNLAPKPPNPAASNATRITIRRMRKPAHSNFSVTDLVGSRVTSSDQR